MHLDFIYNLLPSATKLRRLCFYTCLSVHRQEYLGRYPPGPGTPPWDQVHPPRPGTPPRTQYTHRPGAPPGPGTPPDQVHPPGTRYTPQLGPVTPLQPGTPRTRYTHTLGTGTPPRTRYTPLEPDTPPQDPGDGYCCGRYVSYWNAFLLIRLQKLKRKSLVIYTSLKRTIS